MELRLIIVSVACLSLLVPPGYSTPILAAKTIAAIGAAKGAALLGAGALVKGAVVAKGAAALAAKGAILKGVGILAAKALKAKGASLLAAKGALLSGAASLGAKAVKAKIAAVNALLEEPHEVHEIRYQPYEPAYIVEDYPLIPPVPPQFPAILADRLSGLWNIAAHSIAAKASAGSELITALHGGEVNVVHEPAVIYEVEDTPHFVYPVPVIEKDC